MTNKLSVRKTQRRTIAIIPPLLSFVVIVILPCIGGCGTNGHRRWQTAKHDFKTLPGDMWNDSKKLVTQKQNIAILLLGGAASGYTLWQHDDQVENHFKRHHLNTFPRDFTIGEGVCGNPATHFILAGSAYLYTLMTDDNHNRKVFRSLIEALALNGLLDVGLKVAVDNKAPNGQRYGWPSGHMGSTVTVATVLNEYYGPWVGVPLYALSGFVAYQRLDTREHRASDIVFGAALGYVVGKTVADKYKPELFGMQVMPYVNPNSGNAGVVLAKQF